MNPWQTLWIIAASTVIIVAVTAKDDLWPQKVPLKFLKAVIEQPTLCESGDYESCENAVSTNNIKGNRASNDVYEYTSEEVNIEKVFGDISPVEEKRSLTRAGCDCQLSATVIDLGPASFPRHIRNVTCDQHSSCYHSRAKGLHCLPFHYRVSVIKMREIPIDPSDRDSHILPKRLRCCWKAMTIPTVVGCICGPNY